MNIPKEGEVWTFHFIKEATPILYDIIRVYEEDGKGLVHLKGQKSDSENSRYPLRMFNLKNDEDQKWQRYSLSSEKETIEI